MSTGKAVLGTLAGLAIGAAADILFAPEKGSATRKQIIHKGADYMNKLKSTYEKIRVSITEKFESTKEDVKNATSDIKHAVS